MQTINRRNFLRQSALASAALIATPEKDFLFSNTEEHLTILHTNDVHSHLDPFNDDGTKNAGLGGIAARSALIKKIRSEVSNVLLLDAGDIFQGTPYFNMYKGEAEIKAMSLMQYDASTMGNHDFDAGLDNFATQLHHANFPVIICNYEFAGTSMENKFVPYKTFQKGNIKVGVLGVGIELKGLVADDLYGKTVYREPIEKANITAEYLKKQGCDMVICLSHLGDKYYDDKVSDEILAKECFDIDLIIGGHTHRLFNEPRIYRNRRGGNTLVNQVGWAGMHLGRLDYSFSSGKKKNLRQSHTVTITKKTSE
ncbi:MAG: metallophosphatase [Chitinophaga sp.]|nr:metallophosphatase [Chitinophaga sp.]